jgi:hypothetical protein
VFPVSVALAAFATPSLGPAAFFVFAGATLTVAILAGLTQREWREFGRNQADAEETPVPEDVAI